MAKIVSSVWETEIWSELITLLVDQGPGHSF